MWWARDGPGRGGENRSALTKGPRTAGARTLAPAPPGRQDSAPSLGCRGKAGQGVQTRGVSGFRPGSSGARCSPRRLCRRWDPPPAPACSPSGAGPAPFPAAGREPPWPRRSAARPRTWSLRGARGRARPERGSGLLAAAPCTPAGTAAGRGARTVRGKKKKKTRKGGRRWRYCSFLSLSRSNAIVQSY